MENKRLLNTLHSAVSHLLFAFIYYCGVEPDIAFLLAHFCIVSYLKRIRLDAPTDWKMHALFCVAHFPLGAKWCVTGRRLKFAVAAPTLSCTQISWPIVSSSLTENWGAHTRKNCVCCAATPAVFMYRKLLCTVAAAARLTGATKPDFDLTVYGVAAKKNYSWCSRRRVLVGDRILRSPPWNWTRFKCVTSAVVRLLQVAVFSAFFGKRCTGNVLCKSHTGM